MTQDTELLVCPKGHHSAEADYCSECGAKILGKAAPGGERNGAGNVNVAAEICPDCGTLREQGGSAFCEVCGYNFTTGAHGEVITPTLPAAEEAAADPTMQAGDEVEPPAETPLQAVPRSWWVTVQVDPTLRGADSPEAPADVAPVDVALQQPTNLIGRRNEARGIFPEVALPLDEAVSRRHALLQVDPERGLLLRDIGAANGTRLNGKDVEPMVDVALQDGDEITLGHWSRLRVHAS